MCPYNSEKRRKERAPLCLVSEYIIYECQILHELRVYMGLHAQHASVWAGQVIKGNVFIGSSHTWWNYPYSCINVPFQIGNLEKLPPSRHIHFPFDHFEFYPFVYFRIFVNFWSIELVPSERWSQPAGRTEMLMEGGRGGLWYSRRYLRYSILT